MFVCLHVVIVVFLSHNTFTLNRSLYVYVYNFSLRIYYYRYLKLNFTIIFINGNSDLLGQPFFLLKTAENRLSNVLNFKNAQIQRNHLYRL